MFVLKLLLVLSIFTTSLSIKQFPSSFLFGVSSSAYQVEGSWNRDGKGPNIWDTFTHSPGNIQNNDTGDEACDSYSKFEEDIEILQQLGVKLYRFSISWSRILPTGSPTHINQAGIDHYLTFLKKLTDAGIEPMVTLYHWDLPQHLSDLGGWLNPRMADYFGDYARICFQHFGKYVKYWITLNEPSTTCLHGYETGVFAPGLNLTGEGLYQCFYVYILAHAKAYHIYNNEFRTTFRGKVTLNNACLWFYPATNSSEDNKARKRAMEFNCDFYIHPIYKTNWPRNIINRIANRSKLEGFSFSRLPEFTTDQLSYISGTFDYMSLNTYTSNIISHIPDSPIGTPSYNADLNVLSLKNSLWTASASNWLTSDPPGVRKLLNYLKNVYNPPEIIITENGWSDFGEIDDQGRISYLKGYLSNILDAITEDNVNVVAYSAWSFLDNFEWADGYSQKFGIVHVDFASPNKTRTLKSSARWYKELITSRLIA